MSTYNRTHPFLAKIRERSLLNKSGSSKKTYHLSLAIDSSFSPFQVGDSVGIIPDNDPRIIERILTLSKISPEEMVIDPKSHLPTSFGEYLTKKSNLCKCTSSLLKRMARSDTSSFPPDFLAQHEFVDLLSLFSEAHLSAQEVCSFLLPLMPRFYSIASSPAMSSESLDLTVASLSYSVQKELRHGAASYFLCERAIIHETPIPIYLQPSNGFTLPSDPDIPILLIGPGTGIAPFRAFLQERVTLGHKGKNWLFFGERNEATDFYYGDYLLDLKQKGLLALDLAFSRDGEQKVYVQHKLWERRSLVWEWIQNGARIYVCGDAEKMAKDVEATFVRILMDQAGLTEEKAREQLKSFKKERRYLQDVY